MNSLISLDTIHTDLNCNTFEEIIHLMSKPLIDKNIVKRDFPCKVIEREKNSPTALATETIGVAIPHTDPEYVNHNHISIGILKTPIEMNIMAGEPDEKTSVQIIFLLSLNESNKHLNILQKLMGILGTSENLNKLKEGNKEEIVDLLNKNL